MRLLALDLSTSTGWACFLDGNLVEYGSFAVSVEDFNVNDHPEKAELYPYNIIRAAEEVTYQTSLIVSRMRPDSVVIENTVKGRNRHTQRILEHIHYCILDMLRAYGLPMVYRDPSQWRAALNVRLTNEDKKNNSLVSQGKKRGKVTRKHLAVRLANSMFNLKLLQKHDDIADALLLGASMFV